MTLVVQQPDPTASTMPIEHDLDLLRQYTQTRDDEAFAEIVRRYASVVYAAAYRVLADEDAARDVSQDIFFRLLRQPGLVTQSLAGWLHRSATHLAIDVRRAELSRRRRERIVAVESQRSSEQQPAWNDVSTQVDEALAEMPDESRTLLVRHFLQGTPQAALAQEAGASAATMSRRIQSALAELRRRLKQKGVYAGVAALTTLFVSHATHAAPIKLLIELGKMRMIGAMNVAPPAATPTPPAFPQTLKVLSDSGPATMSGAKLIVAVGVCAAALAVLIGLGAYAWAGRSRPTIDRPVDPPAVSQTR